jgi:hypothetical protein
VFKENIDNNNNIMGISRIEYHELLTSENKPLIKTQTIKSHIPTPSYQDYRQGYIVRYFIQRINDNDALIYEVNETDYLRFSLDEFYNAVNIEWRLIGGEDAIKDSNSKSVKLGSKKMKNLIFYLVNYLQFSGY